MPASLQNWGDRAVWVPACEEWMLVAMGTDRAAQAAPAEVGAWVSDFRITSV